MHLVILTVDGTTFTSDSSPREELLEAAGGDEAKLQTMMDEVHGMAGHIKELNSFSLVIEGVKTYFNPDNIVAVQVFE